MTLGGFFCAFYGSECAVIITIAFMPKRQGRYTMFKIIIKTVTRLKCWRRKNRNYVRSRKQSDYRAVSMAEKLVASGSLQKSRTTGSPLMGGDTRD